MKVLVTGASGLLGRAVVEQLKKDGHDVVAIGLTRANASIVKLDLTDSHAVEEFLETCQPQAVVHTAAERRPDVVESSPEASRVLNVDVPGHLARWCKAQGDSSCPLLLNISTDYVFDGVKPPFHVDDLPNPLNAYGISKWQGERKVQEDGVQGRTASLRVPVLYGRTEKTTESAVNVLLDALTSGNRTTPKKMDANAVRYPTCVNDVAKALSLLCTSFVSTESRIPPILHFSAMEAMTKYDMCLVMARSLRAAGEEVETDHLEPEYEVDPNAATTRPRHCKLDLSVTKQLGIEVDCVTFETWWRNYLQEYVLLAMAEREKEARIAAEAATAKEKRRREQEEEERKRQEEESLEEERLKKEKRLGELQHRKAEEQRQYERVEAEKENESERSKEEQIVAKSNNIISLAASSRNESTATNKDETDSTQTEPASRDVASDAREQSESESNEARRPSAGTESGSVIGGLAASSGGPSSPNPSFSSLQARPTPPATSGRSSPSPSFLSSRTPVATASVPGDSETATDEQASTSTSLTETGQHMPNMAGQQTADPLVAAEEQAMAAKAKTADEIARKGKIVEEPGFFPAALANTSGGSSLGINFSATVDKSRGKLSNDSLGSADSDGYGQPSPREISSETRQVPFAAGYGEVQFGLVDGKTVESAELAKNETSMKDAAAGEVSCVGKDVTARFQYHFQIRVGDPQKIGDPMTAHIVYTVRVKTDSPLFKASQFSVLRRYSDFRWLHAALVHNKPGIFIPPVPEKVKIGRFAPDLVEARRHGLESCINKICNNAVLQQDDDLQLFLESNQFQADVKLRDQIKGPVPTPEQKTYFGWSTTFTGSAYKFHETDEWFDEQGIYLDHLESQLKNLVRVISALAQQRKDLAAAISDFSHALMMLSGSSLSRSLSTCFAGLGEVQRRTFELADVQGDADIRDFGSVIYEHERMVGSARKAFSTRIDAWQAWQKYEDEARKVKAKHEKLKRESQGNHRIHDARLVSILEDVATIDSKCLNQKREFDLIGIRCKEEMGRFEWDRIKTFEDACEVWLQGMIERNQELMAEWEQYAALLERQTGEKIPIE